MEGQFNQELTNRLIHGLQQTGQDGPYENDQQHYMDEDNAVDFQRYLEPNSQFLGQNFEDMDPSDFPGQSFMSKGDGLNSQNESMLRDEELIQIGNNQQEQTGNNAAYQRSRPDGSPMFSQSSGFVAGDSESVVFRPIKQLDFSALDETAMTDVILPRGINRSASTPEHNNRSISMITREQFIENSGMNRNDSPDGNFYELKTSPNQSDPEEELDSKVIFSPLHDLNNYHGEHFDSGMKSPSLSRQQMRPKVSSNVNYENTHENFELTQQTLNETDISPFKDNYQTQGQNIQKVVRNSPQQSIPTFGGDRRSPKYSPSHGQSPHHHSISPSLQHSQLFETREIFVSVPQQNQFCHSPLTPDSLNQSGGFSQKLIDLDEPQTQRFLPSQQNLQSNTASIHSSQDRVYNPHQNKVPVNRNQQVQNMAQMSAVVNQHAPSGGREQAMTSTTHDVQMKDTSRSQMPASNKPEGKPVDKKPWNYAKGQGNRDQQSYLEKGAQKREVLAQHAKSRLVREEPKGRAQEKTSQPPIKAKGNVRMGSGQSTERINKVGDSFPASRNTRQAVQGQSRVNSVPVTRGNIGQPTDEQSRYSGVPVNKGGNKVDRGRTSEQHKTKEDYSPVSQMEHYSEAHDSSLDVQGMEDVRSQLKNMLKLSTSESNSMMGAKSFDFNDDHEEVHNEPYPGNAEYSLMSGNGQDNVSELLENFPSITACMWTDNSSINRNDVSVQNENTRLREILEKERYRRKHCEQQIQKLNIKHLETQQQLAVAVSTDKRKDIMIEQLDKQLGKVLEGWKVQDHEKTISLEKNRQEKMKLEETINKQQKVIDSFEQDMAQALEVVRVERDEAETTVEELRSQFEEKERNRRHAEEMLDTEREKSSLIKQELDMIKDNRDQMDKKFQQLQDRMYQEQDNWFKREQELLNKIDQVSESNVKVVQQEKDKNEELSNRNRVMEEEIHEIQKIIKKMEMEHDAVLREKESLKVEMGIMEAKFESSQRTLEAELASQMEKEISDQMSDLQKRVEKNDSEMREKHYEHTKELNQRHKEDLEKHLANFHRQLKDRDDENRRQIQEYEEKLQTYRAEISNLQDTKQKLEKQRTDILLKLQQMMQSQWNEALSLLATTPQRKRGQFNGPSKVAEFSLSQNGTDSRTREDNSLQLSDLSSREQAPSATQRGNNSHITRDDVPVSTEVNLTDFQTSLHMQQLLQSLSSFTTQPFPAYGNGQPANQQDNDVYPDPHQTLPLRPEMSYSTHEETKPVSYPSSPNAKKSYHQGNISQGHNQGNLSQGHHQGNISQGRHQGHLSQSHHQGNVSQGYHQEHVSESFPEGHAPQIPAMNYSHPPLSYPVDETDEFNNHLQMLLNANRPDPPVFTGSRNDSVNQGHALNMSQMSSVIGLKNDSQNYGHVQSNSSQVQGQQHPHRQSYSESVDHWLRQSLRSQDNQSHDLNKSHASHVSSHQDDYIGQMGMAVPIRPPQQQESFIAPPDSELSSHHPDMSHVHQQPQSACYSPPTKQTRTQALQQDHDPLLNESVRLAKEYNEISDKCEEHEYRQGELQHYIHMLLQKPPGDPVIDQDEHASIFSHDQTEELDLNDTAQAAQIQRELSRIQELREKPALHDETDRRAVKVPTAQGSKAVGNSFQGVLQPEHLAEISKYLEKHKDQLSGKTNEDEHLVEIVSLLRNMQIQNPQKTVNFRQQVESPRSPRDKVKKNLRGQMSKVSDSAQSRPDTSQGQNGKSQGQPKKIERKVASVGPNRHIQNKGKNAWK
ncbi:centrobin [Mytilus galloprovincialis]|uniref:Centrobin n=1 Tax=Mytilus galloprovincialis TaxID=29158 RepID=A0A8B6ETH2_MYTGA|nr:centrobin [Mytilus galloprovincialis]